MSRLAACAVGTLARFCGREMHRKSPNCKTILQPFTKEYEGGKFEVALQGTQNNSAGMHPLKGDIGAVAPKLRESLLQLGA